MKYTIDLARLTIDLAKLEARHRPIYAHLTNGRVVRIKTITNLQVISVMFIAYDLNLVDYFSDEAY